eukprot:TRINITY_DN15319_c0_g1_i1.p1 TRINITY_DN15319_c0_g1~~TRINITY_DN15319_c0_g1_i1.p1  ORF type:complete len:663 (-),score=139.25 TRINITY_DN15319_c0_g1_i1:8-1996(-)
MAYLQHLTTHPLGPTFSTALGILLAGVAGMLLWGLYQIFSTYFFLLVGATFLSEALWRTKTWLVQVVEVFTELRRPPWLLPSKPDAEWEDGGSPPRSWLDGYHWSPRSFSRSCFGERRYLAAAGATLALLAALSPVTCVCFTFFFVLAFTAAYVLDERWRYCFRLHRVMLSDDQVAALTIVAALLALCILPCAAILARSGYEALQLARSAHEVASRNYPEFSQWSNHSVMLAARWVQNMTDSYSDTAWHPHVVSAAKDLQRGRFNITYEWHKWLGNRQPGEALVHYAKSAYQELRDRDWFPTVPEILSYVGGAGTGVLGAIGVAVSLLWSFADSLVRIVFFFSVLIYMLGRRRSILTEMLAPRPGDLARKYDRRKMRSRSRVLSALAEREPMTKLETELRHICEVVLMFPIAKMVVRFWPTLVLSYLFCVNYFCLFSVTIMIIGITPFGSYLYLTPVAALWVLGGALGCFAHYDEGANGIDASPFAVAGDDDWSVGKCLQDNAIWTNACFVACFFVVHCLLHDAELRFLFADSYVSPYAIGLAVLLGFEHFGVGALLYCPLIVSTAALGYRVCVWGELLPGSADEMRKRVSQFMQRSIGADADEAEENNYRNASKQQSPAAASGRSGQSRGQSASAAAATAAAASAASEPRRARARARTRSG